jgi:hypothetical protein
MKNFILATFTLVLSVSAFAVEISAPDALLSILRPGTYMGVNSDCTMTLEEHQDGVLVTAYKGNKKLQRFIEDGTQYRLRPARYFLSSERSRARNSVNYTEEIFMTRASQLGQYMVVEHIKVENRRTQKETIECEVAL